jgi:hypothetical protein
VICYTLAETRAAGTAAGSQAPPLSQETADLVAAILYPHREQLATDRSSA